MAATHITGTLPDNRRWTSAPRPGRSRYAACLLADGPGEAGQLLPTLARMGHLAGRFDLGVVLGPEAAEQVVVEGLALLGVAWFRALTTDSEGLTLRAAAVEALNRRYQGLIVLELSLAPDPTPIPQFALRLDRGADLVFGSRFLAAGWRSWLRSRPARLATWSARTDLAGGMMAVSRRTLQAVAAEPDDSSDSVWRTLRDHAPGVGRSWCEVPVARQEGPSGAGSARDRGAEEVRRLVGAFARTWSISWLLPNQPIRGRASRPASVRRPHHPTNRGPTQPQGFTTSSGA